METPASPFCRGPLPSELTALLHPGRGDRPLHRDPPPSFVNDGKPGSTEQDFTASLWLLYLLRSLLPCGVFSSRWWGLPERDEVKRGSKASVWAASKRGHHRVLGLDPLPAWDSDPGDFRRGPPPLFQDFSCLGIFACTITMVGTPFVGLVTVWRCSASSKKKKKKKKKKASEVRGEVGENLKRARSAALGRSLHARGSRACRPAGLVGDDQELFVAGGDQAVVLEAAVDPLEQRVPETRSRRGSSGRAGCGGSGSGSGTRTSRRGCRSRRARSRRRGRSGRTSACGRRSSGSRAAVDVGVRPLLVRELDVEPDRSPPASAAPRLAASIRPGPPPVITVKPWSVRQAAVSRQSSYQR